MYTSVPIPEPLLSGDSTSIPSLFIGFSLHGLGLIHSLYVTLVANLQLLRIVIRLSPCPMETTNEEDSMGRRAQP